jgi:hypothetical protein
MNRTAELGFPALLIAVVAALILGGFFIADYSWRVLGFPVLAAAVMGALCVAQIAGVLGGRQPERAADEPEPDPITAGSVAWVFALAGFLFAFGFVFGPAAYLLVYLRATGSSWRLSVIVSAASILVTWGFFIKLMRVLLPIEPLWWPW